MIYIEGVSQLWHSIKLEGFGEEKAWPPLQLYTPSFPQCPSAPPLHWGLTSRGRIIPSCWQTNPAAMWGVLLCLFHSGSCLVNMYFLSASDKPRKRVEPSGASVTSSVKWKAYNAHWASRCLPALKSWDSRFHWGKAKPHPGVANCQPHPWHGPGPAPFKPVHLGPTRAGNPKSSYNPLGGMCVWERERDKYSHTSNTSPQLSLSPTPSPSPSPWTTLSSEWARSRCVSRWCDLKKVPTHPTKYLSCRPAWNPHHRHSVSLHSSILLPEVSC